MQRNDDGVAVGFKVLAPGPLTTVQDRGRFGYQAYGVPVAGAVDPYASHMANLLVANDEDAAVLEMTLRGPSLDVIAPAVVAVTGADLGATLNGEPLLTWQAVAVRPGDRIAFGWARSGCRAYLAVAGGIAVPPVMGSRSTYLRGHIGGLDGRPLQAGDLLRIGAPAGDAPAWVGRRIPEQWIPHYENPITLRVVLGPQDDHFTQDGLETFLSSEYTVSVDSDRMGYRLEGARIEHARGADIISDGVPQGAVQVPGHGQPIVMLADRQTTGGYPKIATTIGVDLGRIGQATPGDKVRFAAVSRSDAVALWREQETRFRELSAHLSGAGRVHVPSRHDAAPRELPHRRFEEGGKVLRVDLNSDVGESFGAYQLGFDAEVLRYVTSANIACGGHAGDPMVMAKTVAIAARNGVGIGAHPGYPDLQGFGRRKMVLRPEEVKNLIIYQVGALAAFARAAGEPLQHVKAHGALYNMAARDPELAQAIAEGLKAVAPEAILLALAGSEMVEAAQRAGLRVAQEVFADRAYTAEGTLVDRSQANSMIHDPEVAIPRVVRMVTEGKVIAITGEEVSIEAQSICVHGDNPEAIEFVARIRRALAAANVEVVPLEEVVGWAGAPRRPAGGRPYA